MPVIPAINKAKDVFWVDSIFNTVIFIMEGSPTGMPSGVFAKNPEFLFFRILTGIQNPLSLKSKIWAEIIELVNTDENVTCINKVKIVWWMFLMGLDWED